MDEYREALQKLCDAVEDTMREHYKELGCCSVTRARLDEAKAVLARHEPDTSCTICVGDGSGNLFVHGSYESVKRVQSLVFAAERLLQLESFEPAAAEKARELFTRDEWHDDDGPVLWWRFPIVEPPYCGRLDDDDIVGQDMGDYYTHWTRIPLPSPPAATGAAEKAHLARGCSLCYDCPPVGYQTDKTRCAECPRGAK